MRLLCLLGLLAQNPPAPCPPGTSASAARYHEFEARAGRWFAAREFAKAADELRAGVCFAPDQARAWHALGVAEAAAGRFDRAETALIEAANRAPRDFRIRLSRAQVETSLGRFDVARQSLLEAAQLEPRGSDAASIHAQLARQLFEQKQYDLALAELLRFRQAGGEDTEALLLLARLENTLGAYHDAIRDASALAAQATSHAPVRAAAAAIAGLASKNLDRTDDAIHHLRLATELAAADPGAVFETACLALAEIHEGRQDPAAARQVLADGRKALPGSTRLALALARNLAEANDAGAIPLLEELTAKQPGEAEAYRWLAQAYTSSGDFPRATATLEKLAARRPDYPMIDVMIAQAILKETEPDCARALGRLTRAEKLSPEDADAYYLRGRILVQLGRYAEAVDALKRAIALAPSAAGSYYQLGLAYQRLGQAALAKEQFDRMKALTSGRP